MDNEDEQDNPYRHPYPGDGIDRDRTSAAGFTRRHDAGRIAL